MGRILFFNHSNLKINYRSRISTKGDEFDLVNNYIEYIQGKYQKKKTNLAIFIEPQLDSGYPDIVLIEYNDLKKERWNCERSKLNNIDLKILFEIYRVNSMQTSKLKELLAFSIEQINLSIQKLEKSNLITVTTTRNCVRKKRLKDFYRIRKITSIEAKINKWHDVFEQSYTNQWFANESYILMNKISNIACNYQCEEAGVGIIVNKANKFIQIISGKRLDLPVSFMALLFNEWIWRKTFEEKTIE